ncbi:MAG: alpha-amylase family glycosyl hydrolase, partial [Bacteroidales bacterium]
MNVRQITTFILLLLCRFICSAQVTTTPVIIQQDYSGEIVVLFDATQGNKGMIGATTCYAHTGVITTESANNDDWKHAPEWKDNSEKYKMESAGTNLWKLTIPNMKTYYELLPDEKVLRLAFVFRNADASKEGKGVGNSNLYVSLHEPGLQVAFTNPTGNYALAVGGSLDITFSSSREADLKLKMNGETIKESSSSSTLSFHHTFQTPGDFRLVAMASQGSETVTAELLVCVVENVISQPRPAGVTDGINYA